MSISKTLLDKIELTFGVLSLRELQIFSHAIAIERKRCIAICEAEEMKYMLMSERTTRTALWAGERSIGAADCARLIKNESTRPN